MHTAHETWLIFRRAMLQSLRNPAWTVISLVQPVLYLALFVPLLRPLVGAPGFPPGDEWQVMVPALLVQLGLFGTAFVGFALILPAGERLTTAQSRGATRPAVMIRRSSRTTSAA